jgi:hypothetical protein
MKFLLPVMLAAMFLVGCEKIEGEITIIKDLKLRNSKGDMHLLRVGNYSADIKANTSKKITLRLNNDSDEKFIFKHEGNIPNHGVFTIPASVSGQPVDLLGSINTLTSKSDIFENNVSCSYQEPYTVCYPMPRGGTNCTVQYRTVYGYQWIRYYDVVTTKNIDLSVVGVGSADEAASFHGDIVSTDRVILNQGICR